VEFVEPLFRAKATRLVNTTVGNVKATLAEATGLPEAAFKPLEHGAKDLAASLARDYRSDPKGFRAAAAEMEEAFANSVDEIVEDYRESLLADADPEADDIEAKLDRASEAADALAGRISAALVEAFGPDEVQQLSRLDRMERLIRDLAGRLDFAFSESKVKRGQPDNAGQFAAKHGGSQHLSQLLDTDLAVVAKGRSEGSRADYAWERVLVSDIFGEAATKHLGGTKAADFASTEGIKIASGQTVFMIGDGKVITQEDGKVSLHRSSRINKAVAGKDMENPVVVYFVLHDGPDIPKERRGVYMRFGIGSAWTAGSDSEWMTKLQGVNSVADLSDPKKRKKMRDHAYEVMDQMELGKYKEADKGQVIKDAGAVQSKAREALQAKNLTADEAEQAAREANGFAEDEWAKLPKAVRMSFAEKFMKDKS